MYAPYNPTEIDRIAALESIVQNYRFWDNQVRNTHLGSLVPLLNS